MNPVHLRVVLVRPRNPLNIGAAARAMANFGFRDLAVVKPYDPLWRETQSAVAATPVVLAAEAHNSLDSAIADCHLVVGTTALRDRAVERPVVSLPKLQEYFEAHHRSQTRPDGVLKVALLFGSEKTGLNARYLERCHFWLTIPTDPQCPSMNLGQSVALCSYEWARAIGTMLDRPLVGDVALATMDDREHLVTRAIEVFRRTNFLAFMPESALEKKLRRLFQMWNLRKLDVQLIHGAFRFIQRALGGEKIRDRS